MAAYDLAALWDAHCRYEFETRNVDATMSTMVAEPYVNHIPTMTGGVGFEKLRHFYAHHFIGVNPPDFELLPVSRTVGESSLVDEFIVRFTHTTRMDWMLPGIEPTGRAVEIPAVAIVQFQEDKLVHEHIYNDSRQRARSTQPVRSRRPTHRRGRDRPQSAGRFPAQQHADESVPVGRLAHGRPGVDDGGDMPAIADQQ